MYVLLCYPAAVKVTSRLPDLSTTNTWQHMVCETVLIACHARCDLVKESRVALLLLLLLVLVLVLMLLLLLLHSFLGNAVSENAVESVATSVRCD